MKLAQRIFLGYYRMKLKALEMRSIRAAGKAAFQLFCTPYTRRKSYETPPVFKEAEQLSFQFEEYRIHGFKWQPKESSGFKVLICHGFDSLSYRFEKYIQPLLSHGFEVFAFDAPAHGLSTGKTINALLYSHMILHLQEMYGKMDGIIAHSFGGMAAALAVEKMKHDLLNRLVLIAPATETTRSLNDFCRHLHVGPRVKNEMENLIIKAGGHPSSWFSVARIIRSVHALTLWLHDTDDTITPYADMKDLVELNLPHVEFVITKGLGHSLYRADAVTDKIVSFLASIKANKRTEHVIAKSD